MAVHHPGECFGYVVCIVCGRPLDPTETAASVPPDEVYLGDSVYASFDGHQIWLRTGDGNDQRIALEPAVLEALDQYRASLRKPRT